VLAFTFSESRPERDLRIRGSHEVKLSVSSERCKPPTVHRWQITDNGEGHDPLVSCVDASGEKLRKYKIRYCALSLYCHSPNISTYLFPVRRQKKRRRNKGIFRSCIIVHKTFKNWGPPVALFLLRVCIWGGGRRGCHSRHPKRFFSNQTRAPPHVVIFYHINQHSKLRKKQTLPVLIGFCNSCCSKASENSLNSLLICCHTSNNIPVFIFDKPGQ